MKQTTSKILKYSIIGVIAVLLATLWTKREKKETLPSQPRDYNEIIASGVLRAVTEYNAVSFHVDGDTISGFHYELIKAFARDKDIEVDITPEMSFEKRLQGIENGTYDVIAYDTPKTNEVKDSLLLTIPIALTKQVLVQRKAELDSTKYIKSQVQLAKKTLHVVKGSPSIKRIRNLGDEIADTIFTKEIEKYGPEQLMAMVAHGDIDYAVTDEVIAKASIDSFPQLDISTGISFTLLHSWAVSKKSPELLKHLNEWLAAFMQTKEYKEIYQKYY